MSAEIRRLVDPSLQCPGKVNCVVYKTNPAECLGAVEREPGCLNRARPGVANGAPSPLLSHALRVERMIESGATFRPRDLRAAEWLAAEALRDTRAAIAAEKQGEPDGV